MLLWLSSRTRKVDPEALILKAEASLRATSNNQSKVNNLTAYLETRKDQNHFGDDFEITLTPKGQT